MPSHLLATVASLALMAVLTGCATKGTGGPAIAGKANADAAADALKGTRVVATDAGLSSAIDPLALRMPAQVMRIWIAPWEDSRGDLHAPGYLYTEIEPRRWALDARDDPTPVIRPLQIERREASPDTRRAGRDAGAARAPGRTKGQDPSPGLLGS
jgi:hypothetical protein